MKNKPYHMLIFILFANIISSKAQSFSIYELSNKIVEKNHSTKPPGNIPKVIDCYVDPLIYPINYTANGYTCNKTPNELEIIKKENYNYLSKLFQPTTLDDDTFFNLIINKLQFRELCFDRYFPIDYYDPQLFLDTNKVIQFIYDMKYYQYIRQPIKYVYNPKNNIDSIYNKIIEAKWPLDTSKLLLIGERILQLNNSYELYNRAIQYFDFMYKNNIGKETAKHNIDLIFYQASQIHDSTYDKIDLLNNIALAYLNMGENNKCYKTLLQALESSKYLEKLHNVTNDSYYNTVRLLNSLFYIPDYQNYYLYDIFSKYLINYQYPTNGLTTPIYIYNSNTKKLDAKWNFNLLLKRGIVEFNKLQYYTTMSDSIRNYGRVIIINQLIEYYKYSIRDSFNIDEDVLADLFLVFANYIYDYHQDNDLGFTFQLQGFSHSLDNFDYLQYQNRLINILNALNQQKQHEKSNQLINSMGWIPDAANDHRLYANLLLFMGNNYLELNDKIMADSVYNQIKRNRDTLNTQGYSYYNKTLVRFDLFKAYKRKDTCEINRAKLFLKNIEFNNLPVNKIVELANSETDFYNQKNYAEIAIQRDSLNKLNDILIIQNVALTIAKLKAEANEKEAKMQEGFAVEQRDLAKRRLVTIVKKESTIQAQLEQLQKDSLKLAELNKLLIADTLLLHDKNIELREAKDFAESKTNIANRNKWIAVVAGSIAGVLALLYYLKNKKLRATNNELKEVKLKKLQKEIENEKLENEKQLAITKEIQAKNDRQKAEANLAHKLLTIHNFKGLETAKDDLYFHSNRKSDLIIEKCYQVLNSTFLYAQKLLVNLEKSIVTLEDEFEAIKHYFYTLKISKNKLYNLELPSKDELLKFNDFRIIANVIQPIIENIIDYSGIEKCGENGVDGLIKISVSKTDENIINININDNGCENTILDRKNAKKSTGLSLKLLSVLISKFTVYKKNIMIFDIENDLQIKEGNSNINIKIFRYD